MRGAVFPVTAESDDGARRRGPEGGDGGGMVVVQGTPENIVRVGKGRTARFLKEVLERRPIEKGKVQRQAAE